jgi:hypothetical protein
MNGLQTDLESKKGSGFRFVHSESAGNRNAVSQELQNHTMIQRQQGEKGI